MKPCGKLSVIVGILPIIALFSFPSGAADTPKPVKGMTVEVHSQADIRKMWKDLGISMDKQTTYAREPVLTPPYDPGELSKESTQDALNTLNMIRYIVGIPYNVQIKNEYQEQAQAAAMLMAINNKLSHTDQPTPEGMSEELRYKAGDGLRSSNCASGFSLTGSLFMGYLDDDTKSNASIVGHRRWMINPEMLYTGFGDCGNFTATFAMNRDNEEEAQKYKGVAWPAQNTPMEFFRATSSEGIPWSISLGEDLTREQENSIVVTLQRTSDKKTWKFSKDYADGEYHFSGGTYGQDGACIIFRPSKVDFQDGDQFKVSIKGLEIDVSYIVNFFSIHTHTYENFYTIDKFPTCVTSGLESRHCSVEWCTAKTDVRKMPIPGHNYRKPVFTWDGVSKCSAKFECQGWKFKDDLGETVTKRCPDDPKTVSCSVTPSVTKATLTKNGRKSRAASCIFAGKRYTNVKSSVIPRPKTIRLSKSTLIYNGKPQTVSVSVKDSKGKAIAPTAYTIKGNRAKAPGRYTVTVVFKGNYKGTKHLSLTIRPKTPAITKITPEKKALTVKWQKQTGSGYQIRISTNKNFTKGKTATANNRTVSKKITGLKAKTRYCARVRTVAKSGGRAIYSGWSAAKFVRTK